MNPFERRLAKLEDIRLPKDPAGMRVQFWHSPEGMTDLPEQKRWLEARIAAVREQEPRTLHVHFVRRQTE